MRLYFIGGASGSGKTAVMPHLKELLGDDILHHATTILKVTDRVHSGTREYDLTVDTSNSSVFDVAREIIDFIDSNQNPKGFNNMRNKFYG